MRLFDEDRLQSLADRYRKAYAAAEPFPHVVIDDFLPADVCDQLIAEFPRRDDIDWLKFDRHHSKKLATKGDLQFKDFTREVLLAFNTAPCLRFLEALTSIEGLLPDPYYEGGGLHQIERGGYLKVHTDFNYHNKLKLDRRINLIVYLNRDWKEEYGGHLELWERDMSGCVQRVLPVFNRCVVFSTTEWSFHGHPERLTCPPERTRKSLALYYYSNGRPAEERAAPHGTNWQESRPVSPVRRVCAGMLHGLATVTETPARFMRRVATSLTTRKAA